MDYVNIAIENRGNNLSAEADAIYDAFKKKDYGTIWLLKRFLKSKPLNGPKKKHFKYSIGSKIFDFLYFDIYDLLYYLLDNVFTKLERRCNCFTGVCTDVKYNIKNVYFYDDPDKALCNVILHSLFRRYW